MLAFLAVLTGCVITPDETTLTVVADGTLVVAWQVGASGCEAAGVTQVDVTVDGEAMGTFPCDAASASFEVRPGQRQLLLDGIDAQGAVRYGGETTVSVGSGETVNAPTVVLGALPAELTVTWFFDNGRLCGANGVEDVEVTVFEDDYVVDSLITPCDDGAATIESLVAGTYDVNLLATGGDRRFSGTETIDLGKGDAVIAEIQLSED